MTTASSLHNDLINALTLRSQPDGSWRAPYFSDDRGVVFGGQLLGQGIVAASHQMPDKRVHTVQTLFARGVRADEPADIRVETMHEGRNIGSVTVSYVQDGRTCARMLVLLDAEEPDLVFYQIEMPAVDAPDPAVAQAHPLTAPETIIVGDVDVRDPALTGPANLQLWVRFPDAPTDDPALHRALVAHTTDGWSIATAMRPHPNLGQAMAHKTVSTAVLTQTLSFHGDLDAREWLLLDLETITSGGGRTHGRGTIFTADGRLVASFAQDALLRNFPQGQDPQGKQRTIF